MEFANAEFARDKKKLPIHRDPFDFGPNQRATEKMMAYIDVLARAYRSEPLRRIAIEAGDRVVYLANPEYLMEVEAGESDPVGYPREDVFEFDADLYMQLREQWEREGRTDDTLWRSARLYSEPRAA
jgi:hypothetical protein